MLHFVDPQQPSLEPYPIMKKLSYALTVIAILACKLSAASIVNGGSLSTANADQLATWLGEGYLQLTAIYTAISGDTGSNFHTAVDGKGRTFTVITARASGSSGAFSLLGGYDPLSWDILGNGNYHLDVTDVGRTAFIFNLSTNFLQRQNLTSQTTSGNDYGMDQTYNFANYGPSFGGGHDLTTGAAGAAMLGNTPSGQYMYNSSYGATGVSGGTNLLALTGTTNLEVVGVEVYTISSVVVPEPRTTGLMALVFVILAGRRFRAREGRAA